MEKENRNLVIVGAVLIQLALGAIYAWSVFTPTLKDAGWSITQTQVIFSVGLASFTISMVFAGRVIQKWGPQKLAILGGVILGLGYVSAGLLGATDYMTVLFSIGVIGGIGIGLAYVVPLAVGIRWFPDRKGMITGVAVAGFGFGALLWVKLAGAWGDLLNSIGIGNTFVVYGILFFLMIAIGSIWMKFPSESWEANKRRLNGESGKLLDKTIEFTVREMLKTSQFYFIFLTFVFSAGAGLMAIGLMKTYPMEALMANGLSNAKASAIAGTAIAVFFSLANGIGRIAWGMISDKIGRKPSILIMTLTQSIFVILFTYMAGNTVMLYLAATLIGFNFGGNFALFPALTADIFGTKNVGQNYPYVFLAYGLGGILGPMLGGYLGDMNDFPLAFIISGVFVFIGTILIFSMRPVHAPG